MRRLLAIVVSTLTLVLAIGVVDARAATVASTELTSGWALRSATGLADTGAAISRTGYSTSGWNPVSLPSTVLAGLVANNVYQNIFFGQNLKNVPDLTGQDWWFRGSSPPRPPRPARSTGCDSRGSATAPRSG